MLGELNEMLAMSPSISVHNEDGLVNNYLTFTLDTKANDLAR